MLRITDPVSFSRRVAGMTLVAAPVVLGVGEVLRLSIEAGTQSGTEEHLGNVAANAGLWNVMAITNMVGVILFVPAVLGLIHLLRQRAPILAHLGGALALIGLLGAAGHNVFAHVLDAAMADLGGARAQMVELAEQLEQTASFGFVLLMFIVGFVLGQLLLAIGVYRSRTAPRWAGVSFGLAMLVFANAGTSLPLTLLSTGLHVVGLGTIGFGVLSRSDEQWQHQYPFSGERDDVPAEASSARSS